MWRIAWFAVALVLLTAAPAAQAGWISLFEHAAKDAKDAAKAGKAVEATANGVKIENKVGNKVGVVEATGASVEANGVKIAPGGGGGVGGGGGDGPPVWFYVLLCVVGVGGLLIFKLRGKRA